MILFHRSLGAGYVQLAITAPPRCTCTECQIRHLRISEASPIFYCSRAMTPIPSLGRNLIDLLFHDSMRKNPADDVRSLPPQPSLIINEDRRADTNSVAKMTTWTNVHSLPPKHSSRKMNASVRRGILCRERERLGIYYCYLSKFSHRMMM